MITFNCHTDGSQEDLEAFRLVGPFSGKFLSLTALKRGVSAETQITFENLVLVLHNLNLGYDGMGPGCLEQILIELGAIKEAATDAVQSQKECLAVMRWDAERQRQEKASIVDRLGGDLFTVNATVQD